ncbi:urocanate hydratase [Vagococcus intermedius]|uniref:Urocanate hydratase n=1 Tax=Vagococcus intermedius TaxID=2991418 RepID=A0AAF0CTE3_9ENTE|nr:urocanate hydratase [Vagococcus intermedius]WEG72561.1 urocanate hydratase [Vagococcus intermedius]WEG74647.1 urocanate hydratase [Vagococcus intermedius]
MITNKQIENAMTITLPNELPDMPKFDDTVRRAPDRGYRLSSDQTKLALKNALRYVPEQYHEQMLPEFLQELKERGRIYGYRWYPKHPIEGKAIEDYDGTCVATKALQVMIDNNLNIDVALYPYELVTYGETGQVCANWMQYHLIKSYLKKMTDQQTLVIESGHPVGLFKSKKSAPRVIITNGLLVGEYDNIDDWEIGEQLGVTNYGQMTAGGWMYIGPQGIVHGTFNTLLNAGRLKLGLAAEDDLTGKLFVTSGLGGMSGAQGKAGEIANAVTIVSEVDMSRINTRLQQGWISNLANTPESAVKLANTYLDAKKGTSIAYHGNIVDLLEYMEKQNISIDLLSDQTSCHNVYDGGYCPVDMSFEERTTLLSQNKTAFKESVDSTLKRHFNVIKKLTAKGTYFFDYGNSFMKAIYDSGIKEISKNGIDDKDGFIWPSYVEDIMGPMLFDYGYGPFRWVCLSHKHSDLIKTDQAAMEVIDPTRRYQDLDNYNWIKDAEKNQLVVGTEARILYQDASGREKIALKFNELVRSGEIGPIMLGRDHHDVSGTDSPFRETANIKDGSNITADMATQCFAGNAARGMTLVTLHNGGGVGIGKAINGGFGLVLDGSSECDDIIKSAISWDTMGGVARRSWARNDNAILTAIEFNNSHKDFDHITLPYLVDDTLFSNIVD